MRMYDLIRKKRDGERLAKEEIDWMIRSYTKGEIPDYQMSALMMAIYFRGMNEQETLNLTLAMADSGERLDLSAIHGIKVDKHSTGGVGDKTSLALVPLVASCGIPVAKMSGRGLGHTGGTIDKLESFSGFSTEIPVETFIKNVNTIGISIMGQTADLAPADKKLYALRDVTATVDNLSLIASSIMSKKLAAGADAIVLDVKTGSGAFMKTIQDAKMLAETMEKIGKLAGRETVAVMTGMDQPLGKYVGNTLEVIEAVEALNGKWQEDVKEVVLLLGAYMIKLAGKGENIEENKNKMLNQISNGEALNKFKELVERQGGDVSYIENIEKFKKAKYKMAVISTKSGIVNKLNAESVGKIAMMLGAGRTCKEDDIVKEVGIELNKKVGDKVEIGNVLAYIHGNSEELTEKAVIDLRNVYEIEKNN